MTPIRKSLLIVSVVLTLLIPLGTIASADPGSHTKVAPVTAPISVDPGDGGIGY